jgi:hypothetical protein
VSDPSNAAPNEAPNESPNDPRDAAAAGAPHVTVGAPLTAPVRQRLRLFAKHEESEDVCCQVEVIVQLGDAELRKEVDRYVKEADLIARATAAGKTTWDEDDVCALLGISRSLPALPGLRVVPGAPRAGAQTTQTEVTRAAA